MLIEFDVVNQKLTRITKEFLADKSNNIIQCLFHFKGDDWEGKQRFAILYDNKCNAYQLHLDDTNTIPIPYDILVSEKFSITLYGEDLEENRITTNMVTLRLDPSGYTTDIEDLKDIDPDIWTQIWEAIDGKSDINHTHTIADVTDFPVLSVVALSGDYNDLINKPDAPDLSEYVKKSSTVGLIRNDGSIDTTQYISQHQDLSGYVQKSQTAGLIKNDGTIDTSQYLTEHQDISGKVNYTDIVDNLTTNDATKVLSAKQGKQLADMIGEIQLYVNR